MKQCAVCHSRKDVKRIDVNGRPEEPMCKDCREKFGYDPHKDSEEHIVCQ